MRRIVSEFGRFTHPKYNAYGLPGHNCVIGIVRTPGPAGAAYTVISAMSVSRRQFLFSSTALPLLAEKKPVERPNLLLLLADGLPDWMVGSYGNKDVHTPAIDRLAQTGTQVPGSHRMLSGRATSRNASC